MKLREMRDKSNTATSLFGEFQEPAASEWRAAAEEALNGVPWEKALVSGTWEGIRRQPIYHASGDRDVAGIAGVVSGDDWSISQELDVSDPADFNGALLSLLERGLGTVNVLMAGCGRDGLAVDRLDDLARAFEGVIPDAVHWRFGGATGMRLLAVFVAWLERKAVSPGDIRGCLGIDPMGETITGRGGQSMGARMDELAACASHNAKAMPGFRAGLVNTLAYHEAGASAVTELGVSMASGLWMVRELCGRGMDVSEAALQLAFTQAVGADFFMEIAKFRAARLLWARIVEELGGGATSREMRLHARTGCYGKTRRQPETNLVRATTEALAAVLGGVDSLCVGPFDETRGRGSGFARRIAVNLQLVLQEECGLGVLDPTAGSYYIEDLTDQLAGAAWSLLREIEAGGGIVEALRSGHVQQQIADTHAEREQALACRRVSLVGVNCYVHAEENDLEEVEASGQVAGAADCSAVTGTGIVWNSGQPEELIPSMAQSALAGAMMADLDKKLDGCPQGKVPPGSASSRSGALRRTSRYSRRGLRGSCRECRKRRVSASSGWASPVGTGRRSSSSGISSV